MQVGASWAWKGSSHINILEAASAPRAYEAAAIRGRDLRFVELIDLNLALCALVRGRSSSCALLPLLKRASTLSRAYGLSGGEVCSYSLNPADHTNIPERTSVGFGPLDDAERRLLSSCGRLWRWTSNWPRLCILLCPSWLGFSLISAAIVATASFWIMTHASPWISGGGRVLSVSSCSLSTS